MAHLLQMQTLKFRMAPEMAKKRLLKLIQQIS
jgi:hypothetical protein